jgi:hypothetical protein
MGAQEPDFIKAQAEWDKLPMHLTNMIVIEVIEVSGST